MNSFKKLLLPIAVVTITAGMTNALASPPSLSTIPTLAGDTTGEARAITADGQWVVGISGTRGFLYQVGSASAINVISSDVTPIQSSQAHGVGIRTYGGQSQILVNGIGLGTTPNWNTVFMYDPVALTWGVGRVDSKVGATTVTVGAANTLGASTASDSFYTAWRDNANYLLLPKSSGAWGALTTTIDSKSVPTTAQARLLGTSASGRSVGYRRLTTAISGNVNQNYVMDSTGGNGSGNVGFFTGLWSGNNLGQATAVSADGISIFGQSPINAALGNTNFGYKAVATGPIAGGTLPVTIAALPLFGDEPIASTSMQYVYGCTPDGRFAVGMDYRGTEKAALWNTSDPNSANWTVTDLTVLATSLGILDGFSRLDRAYTVAYGQPGELVIAGRGSWSPDGGTTPYVNRAFVMIVPEPNAAWLLLTGLGFLIGRRVWMRNRA